MNIIIIFSVAFFVLFPMSNSFGTSQTEIGDDVFIFVQTTLRNSDGQLITYLESSKFSHLDSVALHSFLDFETSQKNDPIITINDEKYQVIRRIQTQLFSSENVIASTILWDTLDGNPVLLARFAHDGYPITPGDTLESMWTFVRPVS